MARKTKIELAAEREACETARRLAEAEVYPAKLMSALEEATQKNNYELVVYEGRFVLRDRDSTSRYDVALRLPLAYNEVAFNDLENLEWDLRSKAEERAESERLSALRRAAFAKLSDEEKNALGLTDRNNW